LALKLPETPTVHPSTVEATLTVTFSVELPYAAKILHYNAKLLHFRLVNDSPRNIVEKMLHFVSLLLSVLLEDSSSYANIVASDLRLDEAILRFNLRSLRQIELFRSSL
jgi:hypothetical protein